MGDLYDTVGAAGDEIERQLSVIDATALEAEARISAREASITGWISAYGTLQGELDAARFKIAELTERVAELEGQITPPPRTLWGASASKSGMSKTRADLSGGDFGRLGCVRVFDSTKPAGWANSNGIAQSQPGELVLLSMKPGIPGTKGVTMTLDGLATYLAGFLRSLPTDRSFRLAIHHEPENPSKVTASGLSLEAYAAAWRAAQRVLASEVRNARIARPLLAIRSMSITMGYTHVPASGRNPDLWFEPTIEALYGDPYPNYDPNLATVPSPSIVAFRDWARSKSRDWGIAETGYDGYVLNDAASVSRFNLDRDALFASSPFGTSAPEAVALFYRDGSYGDPPVSRKYEFDTRPSLRGIVADQIARSLR